MINPNPAIKQANMAASMEDTLLEPLNSFHTNTPHNAATSVAPCPKPYETAAPALPAAIRLNELPIPQIMPPTRPARCSDSLLEKNCRYVPGSPESGRLIKMVLNRKSQFLNQ